MASGKSEDPLEFDDPKGLLNIPEHRKRCIIRPS